MSEEFAETQSGVRVAKDFRSNLIIDRYDPVFARMRASKLKHMRSENSEDIVTWNVFRSLRQIDPRVWLSDLARSASVTLPEVADSDVTIHLWESVRPPLSLLKEGDEGDSEVDILLEAPTWVWFIEAKLRSDISQGTTTRPGRDQLLRNVDVGSHYAGVRRFFCTLLVKDDKTSSDGVDAVRRYADLGVARAALAGHRPDALQNLEAVTLLRWSAIARILRAAAIGAGREEEREVAARAAKWMSGRGLA